MANKPFDYTVINSLERPTSSDLNMLQGEAHADARAFMRWLFFDGGGYNTGSMEGFFPRALEVYATSPTSLAVQMYGGIALQNGAAQLAIGGIAGLNDPYSYQVITNTATKTIAVPGAASSGNHRYDLIQVRALFDTERLTDSTTTDIYNPSLNSFGGASRYKTLTTDINSQTPEVLAAALPATKPLSYKVGVEAPLAGPPPAPTPDVGYLPVALILVTDTTTVITSGAITDQRPLLKLPDAVVPSNLASFGDSGSVVWSNGTSLDVTAQGQAGQPLLSAGAGSPVWGTSLAAKWGGTGYSTYTVGNILFADSSITLARLAPGTTSQILRGGTTPSWGTVPAGAFSSNTVPVSAIQYRSNFQTVSGPVVVLAGAYADIATLTADFERGNLQIGIMPLTTGASMNTYLISDTPGVPASVRVKYTITGSFGVYSTYVQTHTFGENTGATITWSIPFATVNCPLTTLDSYTITVAVQAVAASDSVSLTNFQLRAWQG